MASILKVDKLDPQSGTALEIGTSGDTVTVPSGATLDISSATLTPPATMPASSGVNLTALNATQLTSGTVPTARLGSGTASSSTVLYGDQTYKTEPGLTGWTTGGTSNSLIPSATDQGIYLGVDAATAANLLDDYEEGTFTPVLGGSSGTTGQNYSGQAAQYIKIGNMVYTSMQTSLYDGKGTITGSLQLQGLPFTCKTGWEHRASASFSYIYNWILDSSKDFLQGQVQENTTIVLLQGSDTSGNNATESLATANIQDRTELSATVCYVAA